MKKRFTWIQSIHQCPALLNKTILSLFNISPVGSNSLNWIRVYKSSPRIFDETKIYGYFEILWAMDTIAGSFLRSISINCERISHNCLVEQWVGVVTKHPDKLLIKVRLKGLFCQVFDISWEIKTNEMFLCLLWCTNVVISVFFLFVSANCSNKSFATNKHDQLSCNMIWVYLNYDNWMILSTFLFTHKLT